MPSPTSPEELAQALEIISTYPKEEQDEIGKAAALALRALGSRTSSYLAAQDEFRQRLATQAAQPTGN